MKWLQLRQLTILAQICVEQYYLKHGFSKCNVVDTVLTWKIEYDYANVKHSSIEIRYYPLARARLYVTVSLVSAAFKIW
jgi:hypothetical protein